MEASRFFLRKFLLQRKALSPSKLRAIQPSIMTTSTYILTEPTSVLNHLGSVKTATDANREAFGFNPLAAYKDAIARGKLWIATDKDGKYSGHIMFGGHIPQELRIFQIYVAEDKRGDGIAKCMIDTVSEYAEQLSCLNLRADVASDLSGAMRFWQSLGFCELATRRKKNSSGREVLLFYKRLSTPSLLPGDDLIFRIASSRGPQAVNTYVIDLNIFFSLLKKRGDEQLVAQIMQAALAGEFGLVVTPEFREELSREKRDVDLIFDLAERTLPVLDRLDKEEFIKLQAQIRSIVFPNRSSKRKGAAQDESDLRHIAHCIQHGISGFITNEHALLEAKNKLQQQFDLSIYSPQDFKIEHIANAQGSVLDVPLATKDGSVRVSSPKSLSQIKAFLDSLGPLFQNIAFLVSKSQARGTSDRMIVTADDQLCGVYVAHTKGAKHDTLEGVFLSGADLISREIVFQHLLECFLRRSQSVKAKAIAFHLRKEDFDLEKCCLDRGFQRSSTPTFPGMVTLSKIPSPSLVTQSNWSEFRTIFAKHTNIELPRLIPYFATSGDRGIPTVPAVMSGREYTAELFKLETLLSPTLVLLPKRAGVILPIHPAFASGLLSRSEDTLPFPVEEEALLRLEKAYFRKPTHEKSLSVGMPIVFYESQPGRGVIGCARITSVRITDCDNALKLYRSYGVLREAELAKYSDKQGRIQVITFDNFKPFVCPVPMGRLHEIGCAKANLVGPEVLSFEQLCIIVHEGMGIPFRDVLISIQPEFVAKILSGKKTVELRKKPFPTNRGTRIWIYSSSPTSAVEAAAYIDAIDRDTPANIWQKYQHKCGISRADFDAYFSETTEAYALSIANPMRLERRLKLDEIRVLSAGFTPPQYYRYVDHDTKLFGTLVSIGFSPSRRSSGS